MHTRSDKQTDRPKDRRTHTHTHTQEADSWVEVHKHTPQPRGASLHPLGHTQTHWVIMMKGNATANYKSFLNTFIWRKGNNVQYMTMT